MASLSADDKEHKRRLIFRALRPLLNEEELMRALKLWENEFQERRFVPSLYAKRLTDALGMTTRLSDIQQALTRCMLLNLNELGPVPHLGGNHVAEQPAAKAKNAAPAFLEDILTPPEDAPQPPPAKHPAKHAANTPSEPTPVAPPPFVLEQAADTTAEPPSDQFVVFSALLTHLVEQFANEQNTDLADLSRHLLASLPAARLGKQAQQILSTCCATLENGGVGSVKTGVSVKEMTAFLDLIYVWTCEALGPVLTDRLFATAIRHCESLPEARRFPPRRLF